MLALVSLSLLGLKANSWQARLDKALLSVDMEPKERFRNLQRAIKDPESRDDLKKAVSVIREKGFGKGHPEAIDLLWPTGTTARADLEGLTALRKQVPEILADFQAQVQNRPPKPPAPADLPDASTVLNSIKTLATDKTKQSELQEEALDLFRSTPKGLETPRYTVVDTVDGPLFLGTPERIELREYDAFTVAKTTMEGNGFTASSGATGFNTLAAYLFGKNGESVSMSMTMPVEVDGSSGSMSFVLPKEYAEQPPEPLDGSGVEIEEVPAGRLVAAKPFAGLVTDEEVSRQKVALLEALMADGTYTPVDDEQVSVLQYNSPFTIPWRRRNEVAIVVERVVVEEKEEAVVEDLEVSEEEVVAVEVVDVKEPTVVSWYDAGKRL